MRNSGVGFARFFMIEVARILGVGCVPNFFRDTTSEIRSQRPEISPPTLSSLNSQGMHFATSSIPIPHLAKLPLTQRHKDTKKHLKISPPLLVTRSDCHPIPSSPDPIVPSSHRPLVPLSPCPLPTPSQPIQRTHNPKRLLRHMRINLRRLHRLMPQ